MATTPNIQTFWGVFDELQREGDHPLMPAQWEYVVGPQFLVSGREKHYVALVQWTKGATTSVNYLGRVGTIAVFGH